MSDAAPAEDVQGPRIGQIVAGASITLIGIGWLLEVTNVADVPWGAALPVGLMVIGAALMAGARHGPQSGLVVLGVIISIVVVISSAAEVVLNVPFGGGFGEKTHTVTTPDSEYRWGIGKMTVDLTKATDLPPSIEISLGIGELIMIVPSGAITIEAGAGIGDVVVLGKQSSGFDPGVSVTGGNTVIEVNVGLGKVEVRR